MGRDKIRKHVVKCIGKTSCASGFLENGNDSIGKIKRKYVDALIHIQPGTGSYGRPYDRDPTLALENVLDEKVTVSYAEQKYSVIFTDIRDSIDILLTKRCRSQLNGIY